MKKLFVLISALLFFAATPIAASASILDEAKQYVEYLYYGEQPTNLKNAKSITEIVNQLDTYSTYFSEDEFNSYINSINQQTVGIGVIIEEHKKGIIIVNVLENGPAAKAGLIPGDIITNVNGVSIEGEALQTAVTKITGKEGTSVSIEVLKKNGEIVKATLVRKVVSVPNITEQLLYGNVGYISLSSFSENAGGQVLDAIQSLKKRGATSFIFDLRNNGGGFVDAAEDIIGLFPNSPYAYQVLTNDNKELYKATKQNVTFNPNIKVLINKYSASASEMTAAAIKDQQSAKLYGGQSFGKGSMQSFYSLSDGSVLKLTIAHFTGPNGYEINGKGVTPDVVANEGFELIKAHLDTIEESFKTYKKLSPLQNVPLNKNFTVSFNQKMDLNSAKNAIELVELGGNVIPTTITQTEDHKLVVTPTQDLQEKKLYLLLIHPQFKNDRGVQMKNGAILSVSTK